MHSLRTPHPPRQIRWTNVLKTGTGTALVVGPGETSSGIKVRMDRVTLRQGSGLLSCAGPLAEQASAALLEIEVTNSVFDLVPRRPLVELRGPRVRPDWLEAARVTGESSVLTPQAGWLAHFDPEDQATQALESEELLFDGLYLDACEFSGPLSLDPRDSTVIHSRVPRRPGNPVPGIDASRLPSD